MRAYVKRLASGDVRLNDLTNVFLYIRSRSFGCHSVSDIGDFAAHPDNRDRGLTTQGVRDFFVYMKFIQPYLLSGTQVDTSDLPPDFPDAMWANFRRLYEAGHLKKLNGNKGRLVRLLDSFLRRIGPAPTPGRLHLRPTTHNLPHDEFALAKELTSTLLARAAFNDSQLFDELTTVLLKNKLLEPPEVAAFLAIKPIVTLYVVAKMHQCVVDLGDGTSGLLIASGNDPNKRIIVLGSAMLRVANTRVLAPAFTTELDAATHCDPALLAARGEWDFAVEVNERYQLARLD